MDKNSAKIEKLSVNITKMSAIIALSWNSKLQHSRVSAGLM